MKRSRRRLPAVSPFLTMLCAGSCAGLLALASWMPPAAGADPKPLSSDDRSVEESLLDQALAEVDRPLLTARYDDDLDGLIKRRVIRILTSYNRTNFFVADGELHGFEYQLLQQYRKYLKTRVRKRSWPTVFLYIPMPFEQILPALAEGRGDIAAAGLTVTPERAQYVAFTDPYLKDVSEIVVTAKGVEGLSSVEDLSGRSVYVDPGTSYAQSLAALSQKLADAGRAPVEIVPADPTLATEDILELVNAGVVEITVADNHIAEIWSKALPDIVLHPNLALRQGGQIAWAVRRGNPDLLKSLNSVIPENAKGTLVGNILFKRYFEDVDNIESPLAGNGKGRLDKLEPLFRKYAEKYDFDWLKVAALAYQESRLDNEARSDRGAVGVMQILPETASNAPIEIADIHNVESNIHAGVKYLAYLRDSYFDAPELTSGAHTDFALASYNAGPNRIQTLRQRAGKEGLDPNVWFANVEQVARRVIGNETVEYVADVNKYYIAYKLASVTQEERERAREAVKEASQ